MPLTLFGFRRQRAFPVDIEMGTSLPPYESTAHEYGNEYRPMSRLDTLPPELRLQIALHAAETPTAAGAVDACCVEEYLARLDKNRALVMRQGEFSGLYELYPEALRVQPIVFLTESQHGERKGSSERLLISYGIRGLPRRARLVKEVENNFRRCGWRPMCCHVEDSAPHIVTLSELTIFVEQDSFLLVEFLEALIRECYPHETTIPATRLRVVLTIRDHRLQDQKSYPIPIDEPILRPVEADLDDICDVFHILNTVDDATFPELEQVRLDVHLGDEAHYRYDISCSRQQVPYRRNVWTWTGPHKLSELPKRRIHHYNAPWVLNWPKSESGRRCTREAKKFVVRKWIYFVLRWLSLCYNLFVAVAFPCRLSGEPYTWWWIIIALLTKTICWYYIFTEGRNLIRTPASMVWAKVRSTVEACHRRIKTYTAVPWLWKQGARAAQWLRRGRRA